MKALRLILLIPLPFVILWGSFYLWFKCNPENVQTWWAIPFVITAMVTFIATIGLLADYILSQDWEKRK